MDKKIVIDKKAHQLAKANAAINGQSIKEYVEGLIKKDKVDWQRLTKPDNPE